MLMALLQARRNEIHIGGRGTETRCGQTEQKWCPSVQVIKIGRCLVLMTQWWFYRFPLCQWPKIMAPWVPSRPYFSKRISNRKVNARSQLMVKNVLLSKEKSCGMAFQPILSRHLPNCFKQSIIVSVFLLSITLYICIKHLTSVV